MHFIHFSGYILVIFRGHSFTLMPLATLLAGYTLCYVLSSYRVPPVKSEAGRMERRDNSEKQRRRTKPCLPRDITS